MDQPRSIGVNEYSPVFQIKVNSSFRYCKVPKNIKMILVMERYVETLWRLLESANIGLKERLRMAIKLTKELQIAHSSGVVHRDLKPTNIMIDKKKRLALVDFGIANQEIYLKGSCGTPGFNAPEQFSGQNQHRSADIFSLGKNLILILFEWQIGWNLLWSPEKWTQKFDYKLASLFPLLDFIKLMMQVIIL